MAAVKVEDITKAAQDALYVTVGLGVIAFQKAQVQRNELQKQLKGQVADARTQLDSRVKLVEERLRSLADRTS